MSRKDTFTRAMGDNTILRARMSDDALTVRHLAEIERRFAADASKMIAFELDPERAPLVLKTLQDPAAQRSLANYPSLYPAITRMLAAS